MKTDRERIQDLVLTYANAIDEKDYSGIGNCFTGDAIFQYQDHAFNGPAAVAEMMASAVSSLDGTQHLFTNFIIDVEGDTGHLTFNGVGQHWRRGALGGDTWMAGGKYRMEVRRVAGEWKIHRAWARGLWSEGNASLMSHGA